MNSPAPTPIGIKKIGDTRLAIDWSDGHLSGFDAPYLRGLCPCASCVDEWTGRRRIDPGGYTGELTIAKVQLVGRYALQFTFGDAHDTGIYTFEYLRKLCPCEECQSRPITG